MEQGGPTRPSDEGAPREPSAPAAPPQRTVGQPIDGSQFSSAPSPLTQEAPTTLQETIGKTHGAGSSVGSFFGYASTVITVAAIAALWYFIGGLPFGDHDEYGKIGVAGSTGDRAEQTTVTLPGEEVYIYYEETGLSDDESPEAPPGLEVVVRSAESGPRSEPIEVTDVPGFLFSSSVNDKGWEPHGKFEPEAGDYLVSASARSGGETVTFGKGPINPFGPPIVGSILILALGLGAILLFRRWRSR